MRGFVAGWTKQGLSNETQANKDSDSSGVGNLDKKRQAGFITGKFVAVVLTIALLLLGAKSL